MKAPNEKTIQEIKDLLLNKSVKWYYFQIDLNEVIDVSTGKDKAFLIPARTDEFLSKVRASKSIESANDPKMQGNILRSLLSYLQQDPKILQEVSRRIYDLNEIPNNSNATEGQLGDYNHKTREERNKLFEQRIKEAKFLENLHNVVVVAEGDSWFQFPKVLFGWDPVKDIIDHISKDKKFAVKSLAAGGDWLSNIFYTNEYIEALPKISPDVFLISGGGNDMVQNGRIATMVRNPVLEGRRNLNAPEHKHLLKLLEKRSGAKDLNIDRFRKGLELLSDEFFEFLNICMAQYFLLFQNLTTNRKYEKMLILTQGYDFALPRARKKGHGKRSFLQKLVNKNVGSGKWLYEPLHTKRITNQEDKEAVLYAMLHEFNEMLIQLALYKGFKNVFHIDCRGTAISESDWYDELHLKSEAFEKVALRYRQCIRENLRLERSAKKKVYRVNKDKTYSNQLISTLKLAQQN